MKEVRGPRWGKEGGDRPLVCDSHFLLFQQFPAKAPLIDGQTSRSYECFLAIKTLSRVMSRSYQDGQNSII
jgi:hypothetical protein